MLLYSSEICFKRVLEIDDELIYYPCTFNANKARDFFYTGKSIFQYKKSFQIIHPRR